MQREYSTYIKIIPPAISFAIIISAAFLCQACYTLKEGTTMLCYLWRAVPLEKTDDADLIQKVAEIRAFARNLGLKETKNYTTYVELNRSYLAAVVQACADDSFTAYLWSYPVVGKLPYKGFFNAEDAKKEVQKLKAKKTLDVYVRPVDAFSTLGYFRDPLYSFMKSYSEKHLADLIIHESVHATVFIKGQSDFNEKLAEFIGSTGSLEYIIAKYGKNSSEYNDFITSEAEYKIFLDYVLDLIDSLEEVYNSALPRNEKLTQKEYIIARAKQRFNTNYDSMFKTERYKFFGAEDFKINNAYLSMYRLYYDTDDTFKRIYEEFDYDLKKLISAAKTLKNSKDPVRDLQAAAGKEIRDEI